MYRVLPLAMAVLTTTAALADDIVAPINKRFSNPEVTEIPDFQKHVVPLMGKLGCNGRSCHGSFQGQGGFRLSLFGYDFKMDHDGLTAGDEPRVNLEHPEQSLAIQKPTMEVPHEGGERFEVGSWEHRVFLAWVRDGAKSVGEERAQLKQLEITPSEVNFKGKGESLQLKAIAVWSDGSREDVTTLCRFQSNNSQIGSITEDGQLTSVDPGDTHVVVSYDVAVVTVPVIRPVSELAGANYPKVETRTDIDRLVVQKLRKLGVVPSEVSSDAEFLRRVSLDLTGTLPTAQEVAEFLKDSSSDKRSKKINELLETPGYAGWWTTRLCDLTGNNGAELNNVFAVNNRDLGTRLWYEWIYDRVARNVPYDEIMAGLILGKSREPGESFDDFCNNMTQITLNNRQEDGFHERSTMPLFWARNSLRRENETRAISFAYTFMGIRIQCAQCHKHPFDQWTQDDFNEFAGFFAGINFNRNPESRDEYAAMLKELGVDGLRGGDQRRKLQQLARDGKVVPFQEVYVEPAAKQTKQATNRRPQRGRGSRTPAEARLLGDETVDLTKYDDPRQPLVEWLRRKDNRFFARAFVNRVWSNYFNVGIVEPPDDMSLANPPSNAALLDYLADQFVEHNFDMKWLHREILNSDTYQRSWKPTETNRLDLANFSHAIPRRLPAEVAYDSLTLATASDQQIADLRNEVGDRAIGLPGTIRTPNGSGYALQIFGRSVRESNCDCDRSSEASLLQTVYLQNDRDVLSMLTQRNTWIDQLRREYGLGAAQSASDERRLEQMKTQRNRQAANLRKRLKEARKGGNERQIAQLQKQLKSVDARFEQMVEKAGLSDGRAAKAKAPMDVQPLVEQAYLRTLSRYPNDDEMQKALQYVQDAEQPVDGLTDLMWALINTKEFIVNH